MDGGSLLTELRSAIDAQGDRNGEISSEELKLSLRKPWLADQITKLIVKYESELGGDMSKWDAVDLLVLEGLDHWLAEKRRIEMSEWLEVVESVFQCHRVR